MRVSELNASPWALAVLVILAGCGTKPAPTTALKPQAGPASGAASEPAAAAEASKMVFNFKSSSAVSGWQTISDSVVGGQSQGTIKPSGQGAAVFEGTLSQDHGGFVSVRSPNGAYDLGGFTGIEVRFRGDGKRYKLSVKTNPQDNGFEYLADLWTQEGVWQSARIAFGQFKPNFLGKNLPAGSGIDPTKVVSMGFVVANYQHGPFRLEIESIRAYP